MSLFPQILFWLVRRLFYSAECRSCCFISPRFSYLGVDMFKFSLNSPWPCDQLDLPLILIRCRSRFLMDAFLRFFGFFFSFFRLSWLSCVRFGFLFFCCCCLVLFPIFLLLLLLIFLSCSNFSSRCICQREWSLHLRYSALDLFQLTRSPRALLKSLRLGQCYLRSLAKWIQLNIFFFHWFLIFGALIILYPATFSLSKLFIS